MNPTQFLVPNSGKSNRNDRKIFSFLLLLIVALTVVCLLALLTLAILSLIPDGHTTPEPLDTIQPPVTDDQPVISIPNDITLVQTDDAGIEYIGKMVFFGESTTAHLSSRPGLPIESAQVWKDSSGTKRLSSRITSEKILCGGVEMTIAEACAQETPEYVVLSFGLNGIMDFIANKDSYKNNYSKLIKAIQTASPETKIILQTVYPVANASSFSVDLATLNGYIMTLNEWLPEIAAAHETVRVADTASVLRAIDGGLISAYDNGDGIHLSADAYHAILDYLRTHAWK